MTMKKKKRIAAAAVVVLYNHVCSSVAVIVSQSFFAILAGVLRVLLHSSFNLPLPLHYGDFFSVPSFQRPGQYSIRVSVNPHT